MSARQLTQGLYVRLINNASIHKEHINVFLELSVLQDLNQIATGPDALVSHNLI